MGQFWESIKLNGPPHWPDLSGHPLEGRQFFVVNNRAFLRQSVPKMSHEEKPDHLIKRQMLKRSIS